MGFVFGTIFGTVWRLLKGVFQLLFKLIAKIITSLNLSLPFFYLLIGLLLHLTTGIIAKNNDFFYVFHFGVVVVFAVSIWLSVKKIFAVKNKHRPPPPDYMAHIPANKPHVFRIKDDPDYIVYEFYDKYQIFHEDKHGELKYVRTDYKENAPR